MIGAASCGRRGDRHSLGCGREAQPLHDAAPDARDDRLADHRSADPRLNGAKRQRRLSARRRQERRHASRSSQRSPKQRMSSIIGSSARPLSVSAYSVARRQFGKLLALDDALLLKLPQAQRKRARADPRQRALKLTEARAAFIELTHDEQRPLGADDVSGPTDGAFGINSHPTTLPSEVTSQWRLPCAAPSTLDVDPALKQYVQRWYTRLRSGLGGHVSTKGREAPQRGTDRYARKVMARQTGRIWNCSHAASYVDTTSTTHAPRPTHDPVPRSPPTTTGSYMGGHQLRGTNIRHRAVTDPTRPPRHKMTPTRPEPPEIVSRGLVFRFRGRRGLRRVREGF